MRQSSVDRQPPRAPTQTRIAVNAWKIVAGLHRAANLVIRHRHGESSRHEGPEVEAEFASIGNSAACLSSGVWPGASIQGKPLYFDSFSSCAPTAALPQADELRNLLELHIGAELSD
jgi:hypothetical protein